MLCSLNKIIHIKICYLTHLNSLPFLPFHVISQIFLRGDVLKDHFLLKNKIMTLIQTENEHILG